MLAITPDLDAAVAMSDCGVLLSAGPATRPLGEFTIDLPRPRNVAEFHTRPALSIETSITHDRQRTTVRPELVEGLRQA